MNFKIISIIAMTLTLTMMSLTAFAQDYSAYSTEELAAMRGTMRDSSPEERSAFQKEWQNRYQHMTQEERQQYMRRPANAQADGSGYRLNAPDSKKGRGKGKGVGSGSGMGGGNRKRYRGGGS